MRCGFVATLDVGQVPTQPRRSRNRVVLSVSKRVTRCEPFLLLYSLRSRSWRLPRRKLRLTIIIFRFIACTCTAWRQRATICSFLGERRTTICSFRTACGGMPVATGVRPGGAAGSCGMSAALPTTRSMLRATGLIGGVGREDRGSAPWSSGGIMSGRSMAVPTDVAVGLSAPATTGTPCARASSRLPARSLSACLDCANSAP